MADTFSQAETSGVSLEIDSAAASITVHSVPAGRLFIVYDLCLQVEADATLQLRSGATDLTGPMNLLAATQPPNRWANAGFPVFRGAASGDDFIIVNAGTVQVNGWAFLKEVQTQ
jgi:hypothetical protein